MKVKFNHIYILNTLLMALLLLSSCEERPVGPDTVPLKAEIKNVVVKNAISREDYINEVVDDIDTVLITVPMGTDITNLDLDITTSFYSTIEPQVGITDLTEPLVYTVVSNADTSEVMLMVKEVAPFIERFMLTSPVEAIAKIEDTNITVSVMEGTDLSEASFYAEYFGESIDPDSGSSIDLTLEKPTIKVINKDVEKVYNIIVDIIKDIRFKGSIYDGTVHPNDFLVGCLLPNEVDGWVVEQDDAAYNAGVAHFTSLDDDNGQADFIYNDMGLTADPDETTTVFRAKGLNAAGEHYFEIAFKLDGLRTKLLLRNDRIEVIGGGDKVRLSYPLADYPEFSPVDWNIYRVTCNKVTQEFKLYLNEDTEPLIVDVMALHDPGAGVFFGDGGGKMYECLVDYIAFEADGAYAPDVLPLSEIITVD